MQAVRNENTERRSSLHKDLCRRLSLMKNPRTVDGYEPIEDNNETSEHSPEEESFCSILCRSKGPPQIFFLCILLALSFGATIGVVPAVVTDRYARLNHGFTGDKPCNQYGKDETPAACTYGSADAQTAATVSSMISNIITFTTSSLVGSISDRYGRRSILLVGVFLSMIHPLLLVLLQVDDSFSPNWYYGSSVLSGFISWVTVALSSISDVTPQKWRAAGFGIVLASFSVGFALSPSIALTMSHLHVSILSFSFLFVSFVFALGFLPETLPKEISTAAHEQRLTERAERTNSSFCQNFGRTLKEPFVALSILNRNNFIRSLTMLAFFSGLSTAGDQTLLLYYAESEIKFNDRDVAVLFMIIGIVGLFMQGFLLKPMNDCMGEKKIVILSFIAGIAHNTVYAFARNKGQIFAGAFIGTLTGLSFPAISAMKSNNVDVSEQGQIQGALYSVSSLASALGPAAMRLAYTQTMNTSHPGFFFLVGSGFFLVATIFAMMLPAELANSRKMMDREQRAQDSCDSTNLTRSESDSVLKSPADSIPYLDDLDPMVSFI
jgi:DHA1 family tetracycline resistance protein-like MFS transporter